MKLLKILLLLCFTAPAFAVTLISVNVTPHGASMQSGTLQMSTVCYYSDSSTDACTRGGETTTWYSSEPYITVNSTGLATYATNCGTATYGSSTVAMAVVCMANIVATVTLSGVTVNDYATILAQFPTDKYQVILTPGIYQNVVNSATIPSTLVVGSTATIGAGFGVNTSLSGLNPFPGCNWLSSSPSVATINRYGFVTAVAVGTTTITCNPGGNADVSNGVASYVVTVIAGGSGGNTWYVRPDGGTPYTNSTDTPVGQCNGLANAAYPGTGVNQACAFGDFEDLYFDQVTNKKQWVINGGDTVIVYPKTAGYNTAIITSGSTPTNCGGDYEYCATPSIPSGTTAQPTRILGSNYASCTGDHGPLAASTSLLIGYGRYLLNAALTQNVDVECFELTNSSASSAGIGFAYGMIQSAFTSNATFKNLFIHGATFYGVNGATGVNVTYDHVHIRAAVATGYQMDDGFTTAGWGLSNISTSGGLNLTYSNIEWTGCTEIYGSTAQYPFVANDCVDENKVNLGGHYGQGDGLGTGSMTGTWVYDHDIFRYNFQDGLDNLHAGGQSLTLTNSISYGNDGQQFKIGSMDKAIMQNNIALGNCSRIVQPFNGVTLAIAGVNPCRAGGGTFIFEWANTGTYTVQNNTIVSIGDEALGEECEVTWASCANANTTLQNNVIAGYTGSSTAYGSGALTAGIYLGVAPQLPSPVYPYGINTTNLGWATRSNNDFYNVTSYTPTTTAELMVDPLFTSEPPFLTELTDATESILDNYNFMPSSTSPMRGAGIAVGIATDANGVATTTPPVLGALNFVGSAPSAAQFFGVTISGGVRQ